MRLLATVVGDAGKSLIRGAIWEIGASSYRVHVHLVRSATRLDISQSVTSVVSITGTTWQGALDTAIARVMTEAGTPVQNIRVHVVPRNSETHRARGGSDE